MVLHPSTRKISVHEINDDDVRINIKFLGSYLPWFGHHGEYLLVIVVIHRQPPNIEIMSIKFSNFKLKKSVVHSCSIGLEIVCIPQKIATLLNGNLHWSALVSRDVIIIPEYTILSYDLEKEEIREVGVPVAWRSSGSVQVGVVDNVVDECSGRLFAIVGYGMQFEMWIMKEHGVKESWSKYRNINMGHHYRNCTRLTPLGFCWNGELVLGVHGLSGTDRLMLTKYNFSGEKATDLSDRLSEEMVCVCVSDSLLPPSSVWN